MSNAEQVLKWLTARPGLFRLVDSFYYYLHNKKFDSEAAPESWYRILYNPALSGPARKAGIRRDAPGSAFISAIEVDRQDRKQFLKDFVGFADDEMASDENFERVKRWVESVYSTIPLILPREVSSALDFHDFLRGKEVTNSIHFLASRLGARFRDIGIEVHSDSTVQAATNFFRFVSAYYQGYSLEASIRYAGTGDKKGVPGERREGIALSPPRRRKAVSDSPLPTVRGGFRNFLEAVSAWAHADLDKNEDVLSDYLDALVAEGAIPKKSAEFIEGEGLERQTDLTLEELRAYAKRELAYAKQLDLGWATLFDKFFAFLRLDDLDSVTVVEDSYTSVFRERPAKIMAGSVDQLFWEAFLGVTSDQLAEGPSALSDEEAERLAEKTGSLYRKIGYNILPRNLSEVFLDFDLAKNNFFDIADQLEARFRKYSGGKIPASNSLRLEAAALVYELYYGVEIGEDDYDRADELVAGKVPRRGLALPVERTEGLNLDVLPGIPAKGTLDDFIAVLGQWDTPGSDEVVLAYEDYVDKLTGAPERPSSPTTEQEEILEGKTEPSEMSTSQRRSSEPSSGTPSGSSSVQVSPKASPRQPSRRASPKEEAATTTTRPRSPSPAKPRSRPSKEEESVSLSELAEGQEAVEVESDVTLEDGRLTKAAIKKILYLFLTPKDDKGCGSYDDKGSPKKRKTCLRVTRRALDLLWEQDDINLVEATARAAAWKGFSHSHSVGFERPDKEKATKRKYLKKGTKLERSPITILLQDVLVALMFETQWSGDYKIQGGALNEYRDLADKYYPLTAKEIATLGRKEKRERERAKASSSESEEEVKQSKKGSELAREAAKSKKRQS